MFSSRLPARLSPNVVSRQLAEVRASGAALLDLTTTNPTTVGLSYPAEALSALASAGGLTYRPEPFGLASARHAIAAAESRGGAPVGPDQVILTASTSEAYSLLFKLLCDAGDEVLVPEPSYPLFDLLTRLDLVHGVPYALEYHGLWSINRESVFAALSDRTRALLVVSPNNPTGSRLRADDRAWLVALARERRLALISDEVFLDYPLAPGEDASTLLGEDRVLTFTLGGLSKSAGLPQVKLGWMVVSGPTADVDDARSRLDVICDTYLSVSTPVQVAAASLIAAGQEIRRAVQQRIMTNYDTLREIVARHPGLSLLRAEGGWAAVIQAPSRDDEEALMLRLLREQHVIVHPGYFFDFPRGTHVVVSLLPEPSVFVTGITRVAEVAA